MPGVNPIFQPLLRSLEQAREDLDACTRGLTFEQIWARPHGFGSLGFHLRHIAGSTDRLATYLAGAALTEGQLSVLKTEHDPAGADRDALLMLVDETFRRAEAIATSLDPAALAEPRTVGRQRLPTTAIGLLTHIAEHTQRHVGQAIAAAKLARVQPPM